MKLLKKLSESLNSNIVMDLLTNKKVDRPKEDVDPVPEEEGVNKIPGMKGMEDILENSNIGKLAKEVSEELNIESMISNGEGLESLMSGDNMMNIFKTISQKIENSDEGNILEEAMDISKNMKDNPLFSSLMSNMGQGLSQMGAMDQSAPTPHPDNRRINLTNNHDGSATKKRLQKKLQEKKEGKVDVNKKN